VIRARPASFAKNAPRSDFRRIEAGGEENRVVFLSGRAIQTAHEKEPACTEPFLMLSSIRFRIHGTRPIELSHPSGLRIFARFLFSFAAVAAPFSCAQEITRIQVDASQQSAEPGAAAYDAGSAKSSSGSVLAVNSRYLMRDGKPWLPVMGEFHFTRYPRDKWEEEILKMKAAGVDIVATYVIWIHHEEIRGKFDWSGQRDLRAFAQLCAKHGMYLEPRIGPWTHAEVRNGGLPDWVVQQGATRSNDPAYLAAVQTWFAEIGRQLDGLMWKNNGPVIALQLENEYSARGPGAGEEHILKLKQMAVASGLDVPLYFVTGWDNAVIPARAVIPVYGGGYPDAPWNASLSKLPPPEVYAFRFQSRVAANMGAIGAAGANDPHVVPFSSLPYFTAEIGGGIEDTYHRRPVIHPDDIVAMFPVMLGSGVNLYGTYMFQGGENPDGKLTTLQESQATGYPNDLPIKSYDFQAPLGEFGDERASFRKMKVFQYFLNDFGAELAPMMVHAPAALPKSTADLTVPRAAVRSKGDSGFIFLNNYVRGYAMPAWPAAQFQIRLPQGTLQVPRQPVDIPSGSYFIWPFNLQAGGVTIRYSTAQVFTRIESGGQNGSVIFFQAIQGIPVEFAFDSDSVRSIKASSGQISRETNTTYVSCIQPGIDSSIDLMAQDGRKLRLVVLSTQEAENAWKVRIEGTDHLLVTAQDFFADPDSHRQRIWLRSIGDVNFNFSITPAPAVPLASTLPLTTLPAGARVARFAAKAVEFQPDFKWSQTQAAGEAPPVKLGPPPVWRTNGVAMAPAEGDLAQAARWSIQLRPGAADGLSELYLETKYVGDIARLYQGKRLLTDDFFNGRPWCVGLRRFLDPKGATRLDLSVLPLRSDAPVYFETATPIDFPQGGQAVGISSMSLVPEYQLVLAPAVK
jgi:hypothetical protein